MRVSAVPLFLAATITGGLPEVRSAPGGYLVTSTIATPQDRMVEEDLLTFVSKRGTTFAMLRSRAGGVASAQVRVNTNGTVEGDAADPAITCYNVAMGILADGATPRSSLSSLTVGIDSYAVRVPLRLTTAEFSDGTHGIIANGSAQFTVPDGGTQAAMMLYLDGSVTSRQGTLLSARFLTSLVPSPGSVLAQATCSVTPVDTSPPAGPIET